MEVLPVSLSAIEKLSSIKIHLPQDLTKSKSKNIVLETLREIKRTYGENLPILQPVKDMKIDNKDLDEYLV